MAKFGVGQAVERTEDARLLTGRGRYTDDINLEGQVYGVVLRSPHAHAEIRSIDTSAARSAPGVLAVYTAADIRAAGLGTIPCMYPIEQKDGSPLVTPPHPILAEGRVRHVGDPVAFVVAESPAAARDAAELIEVDYAPLPAIADTATATDPEAPQIWDEAPRNTCFVWADGDEAATEAAFARAAEVVTVELVNNRVVVNPMEPRAALGDWDGERFTLYTPTQGPHSIRFQLAKHIFKVPTRAVRVVTPDVGGGFGMKIFLYAEQPLVLFAARELGRPVKWTAERSADGFVSDSQGRDQINRVELALDANGRFLALKVRNVANLGAYISNFAPFIPTACGAGMLNGVYAFEAIHVEVTGVFTNTVPVDAYRGAGRPEAIYIVERAVDAAARRLGIDPAELRRRNFIRPEAMPCRTAMGLVYDSGDFARNLDEALRIADAEGFPARRRQAAGEGKLRGLGLAYYVEACGGGPGESANIEVAEDGTVTLLIGTQSNGQGHETAYAQVIAERLGIDLDRIRVVQGDTDLIAKGNGTGGSRSLPEGGIAVDRAAAAVIEKGRRIAARVMEAAEVDIEFRDGTFVVAGTDRRLGLAEAAQAARDPTLLPEEEETGLTGTGQFMAEEKTFPNGCHVCEVEIDRETGTTRIVRYTIVDDFGTVVNPLLLRGQVHGGVAQGVGQALLEGCIYDEDGQLLTGSFMDYAMPRADDLPEIGLTLNEDIPCKTNPMGMKGAGEAGAVGAPPAVINAILDALAPLGVTHLDMPATPERVWRAMADAA